MSVITILGQLRKHGSEKLIEKCDRVFAFGASASAKLELQPSNVSNRLAILLHRLKLPLPKSFVDFIHNHWVLRIDDFQVLHVAVCANADHLPLAHFSYSTFRRSASSVTYLNVCKNARSNGIVGGVVRPVRLIILSATVLKVWRSISETR